MTYQPHGMCWLWDYRLILLHAPSDFATFIAYSIIVIVAAYVYRCGTLSHLRTAYPRLWKSGVGFIGTCGLSHLGNFLEVWYGGGLYWMSGVNKVIMAVFSLYFAVQFYRVRDELVLAGRVLHASADFLQAHIDGERVEFDRKQPQPPQPSPQPPLSQ